MVEFALICEAGRIDVIAYWQTFLHPIRFRCSPTMFCFAGTIHTPIEMVSDVENHGATLLDKLRHPFR